MYIYIYIYVYICMQLKATETFRRLSSTVLVK